MPLRTLLIALPCALVATSFASAQTTPPAAAASAPSTAASGAAPARRTGPAAQQIEITGARESDADQRRLSTAAKIVIGRDEIERFGDSSVSEVLKRLPGVTTQGPPGRGGPPRMRGLGAGYTQLLIDGQRPPAGFSLDQLTPEQLERIEIFRAPTAETGARAIGGTINIVLREGFKAKLNDLRTGFSSENGRITPGLFWTHNDSRGEFIYNLTGAVFAPHRRDSSRTTTIDEEVDSGVSHGQETSISQTESKRLGMNLNARLQWRGEGGDLLMLMPGAFAFRGDSRSDFRITEATRAQLPGYNNGFTDADSQNATFRLNTQWRKRIGGDFRLELGGHLALNHGSSHSLRHEMQDSVQTRLQEDSGNSHERSLNLTGKLTRLLGEQSQHNMVLGWELESGHRNEQHTTLSNGVPLGSDDDAFVADVRRLALFAQDEWALNANWSLHAGLRTEGIRTVGENPDGTQPHNHSQVTTPLVHLLFKPDPKKRDQFRLSLTRSYKSPTLNNLIARPSYSARYADLSQPNAPTSPDRFGNPDLRPELATGIDLAFERYLADGGVLSANVFVRRLRDYIRSVTSEQVVSYSPARRWISRPMNVGNASTAGIELEAKFRLDQMIAEAPRVEIRSNLSLFRSRVDQVPGPDNRLDQQPGGTLNLGADHRFRGTPLTLGGNVNFTPAYRTQLSDIQAQTIPVKRQFDAYALWVFKPGTQLRLNLSNLAPNDYVTSSSVDFPVIAGSPALRERAVTTTDTFLNLRLSLELKL